MLHDLCKPIFVSGSSGLGLDLDLDLDLEGPVASSAEIAADGKSVVVTFNSVGGGGIDLRSEHGFSLCPAVHAWSAAECYKWGNSANFVNSTSVLGSAPNQVLLAIPPEVANNGGPAVVMYEWDPLPCNWPTLEGCGVYSKEAGPVHNHSVPPHGMA